MAQAYGSAAHPVDLGPFSRIVEVHWAPEKYFALLWTPRGRSTFVDDTEGCSPPDYGAPFTGYPLPPHPWSFTYLSEVEYYLPDGEPQGIADMVVRRGNEWHGLAATPVVTGLPTLPPASSHGAWEQAWLMVGGTTISSPDTDGVTRHAEHDLAASFRPDSGDNTDIDVPNAPGFFQTGFTPAFGFSSPAFYSADPICVTDGSSTSTSRMYHETPDWIDTVPVPLADIVVTYKDKTFRGMAARPFVTVHAGEDIALGLWILCEREGATA